MQAVTTTEPESPREPPSRPPRCVLLLLLLLLAAQHDVLQGVLHLLLHCPLLRLLTPPLLYLPLLSPLLCRGGWAATAASRRPNSCRC